MKKYASDAVSPLALGIVFRAELYMFVTTSSIVTSVPILPGTEQESLRDLLLVFLTTSN